MKNSQKVIHQMYKNDAFSQWLGIEIVDMKEGFCELKMIVREEMLNGFQIAHGGIAYSFADSALAFASNARGRKSLSVETSISHTVSVKDGDVLTAITDEVSLSDKFGVYLVTITNQKNQQVAIFKGTVYRTSKKWFSEIE
ncbi:MAG: thioesterase [Candidatus Marinimicrobia bacterium]|nr:thioesterase [Candidatus Neomarinimicrobiota bacterium]|tara:strand:- start:1034 stop:1456 length:423 start_codon:yes stop_codon:yes gene_type:complete